MLITVSRQMGAGGARVARRVADQLGWRVVDNECVDEVARRANLSPAEVAEQEERAPGFLERLVRSLANATGEFVPPDRTHLPEVEEADLVRLTQAVVAEFAEGGRVVMVGRAAPAVLATRTDALHVRVVAPLSARVAVLVERKQASPDEAEALIRRTDAARQRYLQVYYQRDWADPTNYHMVLNTQALTEDGAAQVVVDRANRLWGGDSGGAG